MPLKHFGSKQYAANHFSASHLAGIDTYVPPVELPVIPLPSVGGYTAPGRKKQDVFDDIDYDDEQILMRMIQAFLEGQE